MSTETQLDLLKSAAPSTLVTVGEIERVCGLLRENGEWMTAKDIALALHQPPAFERRVRAIASAAVPQIVSFPGSPGYKLWQHCSVEEINHCIEAFQSQGNDMLKRAVLYSKAYHSRYRGETSQPTSHEQSPLHR